jgi:hypothetical protein
VNANDVRVETVAREHVHQRFEHPAVTRILRTEVRIDKVREPNKSPSGKATKPRGWRSPYQPSSNASSVPLFARSPDTKPGDFPLQARLGSELSTGCRVLRLFASAPLRPARLDARSPLRREMA